MSPAQRIAAVLHSRGREVSPARVQSWIDRICKRLEERFKQTVLEETVANLVEHEFKPITMLLHMEFGDAL